MKFATVRDLKINASEIIKNVEEDEDVIVTKRGRPVALLIPITEDEITELIKFIRSIKFQKSLQKMWGHSEKKRLNRLTPEEIEEERIHAARKEKAIENSY